MEKPGGIWIPKKSKNESSWEELAFAEDDAAGSLWPPRSYTCTFCRREFRSAQALGGHMNVHRRDRARLKQGDDQYLFPKNPSSPEYPSHNDGDDIRETSCYTLVFNSKPNCFKSQHSCVIDLSSSSSSSSSLPYLTPPRVSSGMPGKQNTSSPSFVVEPSQNSKKIPSSFPWSRPSTFLEQKRCDLYETPVMEGDKKRKIIESDVVKIGHKAKLSLGNTTDLSVSMNLVIHQSFPVTAHGGDDEEIRRVDIRKRRRRHDSSSQPAIFISSLSCKSDIITRNEGIKYKADGFEDLDLELRLGTDPPKIDGQMISYQKKGKENIYK